MRRENLSYLANVQVVQNYKTTFVVLYILGEKTLLCIFFSMKSFCSAEVHTG